MFPQARRSVVSGVPTIGLCLSVSFFKGDLSREILFGWPKWVALYKNWYCQKAAALFNSCSTPLEVLGSRGKRLSGLIPWRTFQVTFRLVIDTLEVSGSLARDRSLTRSSVALARDMSARRSYVTLFRKNTARRSYVTLFRKNTARRSYVIFVS